jgi:hypothetical protein
LNAWSTRLLLLHLMLCYVVLCYCCWRPLRLL